MTSEEYAAMLNPNPVPPSATSAPSPMDLMMLQNQQAQERTALGHQQRVSDALLQSTNANQAASAWRGRRQNRFATPPSGLAGIGSGLVKMASAYAGGQAQDALRDAQQQAMLRLSPMPPSASVATSDPANYMQDPELFSSFGG